MVIACMLPIEIYVDELCRIDKLNEKNDMAKKNERNKSFLVWQILWNNKNKRQ